MPDIRPAIRRALSDLDTRRRNLDRADRLLTAVSNLRQPVPGQGYRIEVTPHGYSVKGPAGETVVGEDDKVVAGKLLTFLADHVEREALALAGEVG